MTIQELQQKKRDGSLTKEDVQALFADARKELETMKQEEPAQYLKLLEFLCDTLKRIRSIS